jgi:prepilin-type N-terminal cleavage/methylation domain-containing protein
MRNKQIKQNNHTKPKYDGFTVTELIIATTIIGTLGAIAAPSYFSQLLKAKQNSCMIFTTTTLSAVMGAAGDAPPKGWDDVSDYKAVMTKDGPARGPNFSNQLNLNEGYKFTMAESNPIYETECIPSDTSLSNYNVLGCVNIETGAFQIKEGDGTTPATKPVCI